MSTPDSWSSWQPQDAVDQQQPLPAGRTTNTWAIWVTAILPLLGLVTTLVEDPGAQIRRSLARTAQQLQDPSTVPVPTIGIDGATLASSGISLLILAVQVFLAISDQRALRRLGVVRPFSWGWVFLNPTYVIGRHVVVRRRVHGSLAPLWVWIATTALSIVVTSVVLVAAFQSAFATIDLLGS